MFENKELSTSGECEKATIILGMRERGEDGDNVVVGREKGGEATTEEKKGRR